MFHSYVKLPEGRWNRQLVTTCHNLSHTKILDTFSFSLSLSVFVMGNCRDCHNEVHAKEATDRILRLLIVKVPFEEVAEP